MSFKLVDSDKNLGYFLVRFVEQDEEYWQENLLNPITLENGEYFVQLGELVGGDTSITWLDEDKKPLSNQQVTELYLSITDNVRSVILDKDSQTKPL
jgi:outer membrane protein assembly factor BamC